MSRKQSSYIPLHLYLPPQFHLLLIPYVSVVHLLQLMSQYVIISEIYDLHGGSFFVEVRSLGFAKYAIHVSTITVSYRIISLP